ncbi:hypothetical protein Ciccas_010811 [Cichlidogyrus casuarinus]|uniref:RRM domain-containing protein n=1 Tax=Cichlidogyrus casuarinus TaxID=1844966 RepID=A0ABD2PTF9_9PLAT
MIEDEEERKHRCQQVASGDTGDELLSVSNQTNLIVNYLPPYMSQDEVKALFSTLGEVTSCKLVREKSTGESLGYAFVKFFKSSQAKKAIESLNGLRLQNKTIKVSLARPSSESIKGANLYICGLPKDMTQVELESLFGEFGNIITARILYDKRTGISRGIAFIRFDQRHEAEQAIKHLNGYRSSNSDAAITVKFANSPTVLKQENLNMILQQSNQIAKQMTDYNVMKQFFGGLTLPSGWRLAVQNLSPEMNESDLWQLFVPFGAVKSVKLSRDWRTNKSRNYAFVTMNNYEEAFAAVQTLNGVSDNAFI